MTDRLSEHVAGDDRFTAAEKAEMNRGSALVAKLLLRDLGREAEPVEKHYAHFLDVTSFIELQFAAAIVKGVFDDSYGIFLVGSALTRKDWRDVDLRHIISDAEFERRFGEYVEPYDRNHFLRAFNLGVSGWIRERSRLPIDYQVQPITKANELYPHGSNPRNSIGLI